MEAKKTLKEISLEDSLEIMFSGKSARSESVDFDSNGESISHVNHFDSNGNFFFRCTIKTFIGGVVESRYYLVEPSRAAA